MAARKVTIEARQNAFLAAYAQCGTVVKAAQSVGIDPHMHWTFWSKDEKYMERFAQAELAATDLLVGEARRRAFEGVTRTYYTKSGEPVTEMVYSDRLLEFLLKGFDRRFRDRVEMTGKTLNLHSHEHNGQVVAKLDLSGLNDEQLGQLAGILAALEVKNGADTKANQPALPPAASGNNAQNVPVVDAAQPG